MKRDILNRVLRVFGMVLSLAAITVAQELTQLERDKAIRYLVDSRNGVQEAVTGLTEAQLNFKPSPFRWSIAEIIEHLAIAEERLNDGVFEQLKNSPASSQDRDPRSIDEMILSKVPDRSAKFQAPDVVRPTGRWTVKTALEHFLTARAKTITFLQTAPDLRRHQMNHPALGPLDGYQWALAVAAHSERHTRQIAEVKNDPHFPAE
jgi:DinB family protein